MSPIWKYLPAKLAHDLAPVGLKIASEIWGQEVPLEWRPVYWRGLKFYNPLGIAGGVDKDASQGLDWQRMGAGFVEIGTITPEPQHANPGLIVDRDWENKNLWNKMGFPNEGAKNIRGHLSSWRSQLKIPLMVNIGKNRATPEIQAVQDYQSVMKDFRDLADVFVLNVSSPNTQGLRNLQKPAALIELLKGTIPLAHGKPVLVKLSPDMDPKSFVESLQVCMENQVSGFVLTNTTRLRPKDCPFPEEGGLSGHDLAPLSLDHLKLAVQTLGTRKKDFLLVSAGGVMSRKQVQERLDLGADLIQVYSALVFEGPRFFQNLIQGTDHD